MIVLRLKHIDSCNPKQACNHWPPVLHCVNRNRVDAFGLSSYLRKRISVKEPRFSIGQIVRYALPPVYTCLSEWLLPSSPEQMQVLTVCDVHLVFQASLVAV